MLGKLGLNPIHFILFRSAITWQQTPVQYQTMQLDRVVAYSARRYDTNYLFCKKHTLNSHWKLSVIQWGGRFSVIWPTANRNLCKSGIRLSETALRGSPFADGGRVLLQALWSLQCWLPYSSSSNAIAESSNWLLFKLTVTVFCSWFHAMGDSNWAHDVVVTLNQRQRRWFNVAT